MGFPINYPFILETWEDEYENYPLMLALAVVVLLIGIFIAFLICCKCWRDRRRGYETLSDGRRDQQETELEQSGQNSQDSQNSQERNATSERERPYRFPNFLVSTPQQSDFPISSNVLWESIRQSQSWAFGRMTKLDDLTRLSKTLSSKKGKFHVPSPYLYSRSHSTWSMPATIDITGRIIESNPASLSPSPEEGGATGGMEVKEELAMSGIKGSDTRAETEEKEDSATFETKFAAARATFDDAGAQLKNLMNERLMPSSDHTVTPNTIAEYFGGAKPKVFHKTSIKRRNKKLKRKSKKDKNKD